MSKINSPLRGKPPIPKGEALSETTMKRRGEIVPAMLTASKVQVLGYAQGL